MNLKRDVLNQFVVAKVTLGGGQKSKQDKSVTAKVRQDTGDTTMSAVCKLYPKGAFDVIVKPMENFHAKLQQVSLSSVGRREYLVPVKMVAEMRTAYYAALAEHDAGIATLSSGTEWAALVAKAKANRGGHFNPGDYPSVPPLRDWFQFTLVWRPHPTESAFSRFVKDQVAGIESEIEADMAARLDSYVQEAKDDIMGRARDALGKFLTSVQSLRTETRVCPECGMQWPASHDIKCPSCGTVQPDIKPKAERVYEAWIQNVRDLAKTLGAVLPDVDQKRIDTAFEPVTGLCADEIKLMGPVDLMKLETQTVAIAKDVGDMVLDTFGA